MDGQEQIKKFEELIDLHYRAQLLENIRKGKHYLIINFSDISRFDPLLAEELIEFPEETIKSAELSIKHFDIPDDIDNVFARIINIPKSQHKFISSLRAKNISKLICVDGVVRQKSDVRPQVTTARFECPACGNIIAVLKLDAKFKEPTKCGCGRKGNLDFYQKN